MGKKEIIAWIENFLMDKLGVPCDVAKNNYTQPLTSSVFGLDGIDLTYLFMELKRTFSFDISPETLTHGGFLTIERIAETFE